MTGIDRARLAYGTVLAVQPRLLARRTGDTRSDHAFSAVVRVLGLRHVVQALVSAAYPSRRVIQLGAAADALHATTDITCGLLKRRRAAAAFTDAGVAIGFVVVRVGTLSRQDLRSGEKR